jgi:hypothetical protein
VPEEALVRPDSPPATPGDSPLDGPQDNPVHVQIARLEGELAGIREALAEARSWAIKCSLTEDASQFSSSLL